MRTMRKFYDNYDSINQFTHHLKYHQNQLECTHCLKHDQFVSHGIIYKQRSIDVKEKVGKRIFCSNRYGRTGCGRTFQLYLAMVIPRFRYGAAQLFIFISSLLAGMMLTDAYCKATAQTDSRNGWRWLNRLRLKLAEYRTFINVKPTTINSYTGKSHQLKLLLPTLNALNSKLTGVLCLSYQITTQKAFI